LFRDGRASISREVAEFLDRLGRRAQSWQARLEKLSKSRLFGRFFAASRKRLRSHFAVMGLDLLCLAGDGPHEAHLAEAQAVIDGLLEEDLDLGGEMYLDALTDLVESMSPSVRVSAVSP